MINLNMAVTCGLPVGNGSILNSYRKNRLTLDGEYLDSREMESNIRCRNENKNIPCAVYQIYAITSERLFGLVS
jgi:hypothetical protein